MQMVFSWNLALRRLTGFSRRGAGGEDGIRRRLSARKVLGFSPGGERRLRCVSGCLWITDGDGRDVVLTRGDTFFVTPGRRVVVEALVPSVIEI